MGRAVVFTCVAAIVVFAVVQDRVTGEGAGRYVSMHREAAATGRTFPTIDEVMKPAVRDGVQRGMMWGGTVLVVGLGGTFAWRRSRRE